MDLLTRSRRRATASCPARRGLALVLGLATLLCGVPDPGPRADEFPAVAEAEYRLKAAYLLNFSRFTTWPGDRSDREFRVGVAGDDPFGPRLERTFDGRRVHGRTVRIVRTDDTDALRLCEVVFVGAMPVERERDVLRALRGAAVLTVGEREGFLADGGVVRLRVVEDRVRFDVDLASARRAGVVLDSRLLDLASRVVGEDGR